MSIDEYRELRRRLLDADKAYYLGETPTMSDYEYDMLVGTIMQLAADDAACAAELKKHGLPVGTSDIDIDMKVKFEHPVPVKSLDKLKLTDSSFDKKLLRWAEKVSQGDEQMFVVQPKLDGAAVVVYGTADGDTKIVTRGGGSLGEDVTTQFNDVTSSLDVQNGHIYRGEAVIARGRNESGRSAASGAIRSLRTGSASDAGVEIVIYQVLDARRHVIDEEQKLEAARAAGFNVVQSYGPFTAQEAIEFLKKPESEHRENCPWPIDGLVIKPMFEPVDSDAGRHHDVGQLAVKFAPHTAWTTLTGVEWREGKSGKLTPIALYETITVDGRSFARASLGSYAKLVELDLHIGDLIEVGIMNDVIPKVLNRKDGSSTALIELPDGAEQRGAHLFMNTDVRSHDAHWLSLLAATLNYDMPAGVCSKLRDAGLTPADVINSTMDDEAGRVLTRREWANLRASRDANGRPTLAQALQIVGADGVGAVTAQNLSSVTSLDELASTNTDVYDSLTPTQLTELERILA